MQSSNDSQNNHSSISQLASFGLIKISGVDCNKFLQGQITINVESIEENKLALAATCNPQGRILSLFFITKRANDIYLILPLETIESTIAHFKKYAVFFKVTITDESQQFDLYGLNQPLTNDIGSAIKMAATSWKDRNINIFIVNSDNKTDFETNLKPLLAFKPEQNWLAYLALNRIAWLESISQAEFLPHNLDLPLLKAVDFQKGCFTGQEVIARMQYKGKLKSHLQLFQLSSNEVVSALETIYVREEKAAQIICSARDEKNKTLILALLKDGYLEDKIFHLNHENGPILNLLKNH